MTNKNKCFNYAVILLAFTVVMLSGCRQKNYNGTFENTTWGMTVAEVNSSTKRLLSTTAKNTVTAENVGEIDLFTKEIGVADSIVYYFDNDGGLCQVLVSCSLAPGSMADELTGEIKKNLDSRYEYDSKTNNTRLWNTKTGSVTLYEMNSQIKICFSNTES